ncbi:MAG: alanine--glyoxylate aminotransferase family protein [Deltaproteobacteria bacterium]|nr:MAG: alanine--glyoxylate aminotransferase family protein [Deltaproteobacteria bacterium]
MKALPPPLSPPVRLLLGPGPSPVPKRVLDALATPTIGHLDPAYLEVMDAVQAMLRTVLRTESPMTFAVSGTGMAGMECCIVNLVEPGDEVLVCVNGVFGERMAEIARRAGAVVRTLERPWGEVFTAQEIADALAAAPAKLVGIVMAETSTGAHQPIPEVARAVRDAGALLLVDAVTALGGMPVEVDAWGIDACYAGTQKCLSCPPGLAPVTFGPRAVEAIERRRQPVRSWYLDVSLLGRYWGGQRRAYHHTAPVNMTFALYEALRIVLEEGLEARYARHRRHHEALARGLEAMGLSFVVSPEHRLPMLNAVRIPEGVDDAAVRRALLDEGIEIGSGLGPFAGSVWRIGLMGHGARRENVIRLLRALRPHLPGAGDGEAAAQGYYDSHEEER